MKKAVCSPFYPVADKTDTSHRAGWARYWANELGATLLTTGQMGAIADLKKGDQLHCYHGMEFKGQLNLRSGLTDEILGRTKLILEAAKRGVEIISLDQGMPNYGALLADRGMDPTSADKLTKVCTKAGRMLVPQRKPKRIVIGDSHALSQYIPGSVIVRNDSLTLHGALNRLLHVMMDEFAFESSVGYDRVETLTVYFGNIDIRHHLNRQADPKSAIRDLVKAYGLQLQTVQENYEPGNIEIVLPLPIEDESRPIPKSGWYKGEPFSGDWSTRHQLRLELRDRLKQMAKKHGFATYEHPKHFTDKSGKLLFDVLEKPRSVHIRPAEYRLVQEGGAWTA